MEALQREYEKLLNAINACGKRIVAIDIPSGLRGDNGLTLEAAVEADQTTGNWITRCWNATYPN